MQPPLAELLPALAEASRTVGSPQIRNRGTIGGNLGTASPAGDALPPLLVEGADVELASVRGTRSLPLHEFLLGPKRNALEPDELVAGVRSALGGCPDVHEGRAAKRDGDRGRLADARGRSRARGAPRLVRLGGPSRAREGAPRRTGELPEQVAAAASPIDDVRGTAAYRRHALRVLTARALERCLA